MPQAISYTVREFVRERLEATDSTGFNTLIQETCATYNVPSFQLSTTTAPPTLLLGRYDRPTLERIKVNFPCAVLSTVLDDSRGKLAMRITPSTYAGPVRISVDFWVGYNIGNLPPDGEAIFHAVEEAFINTFDNTESYGLMPSGVTFNNELIVAQGNMEWNQNSWLQHVPCGLDFYLIT